MATTNTIEGERGATNTGSSVDTSPVSGEPNNGNTIYIHVDPSSFRAVVQQLTGAPMINSPRPRPALSVVPSSLPPAKRPKLQERRRGMAPAMRMLDIPFATHLQIISQIRKPVITDISLSPVSTIDYAFFLASNSPVSPPAPFARTAGRPAVVLTKEEEEREEKAIAEKGFYLHCSPRGGEINGANKPKLLPLFPVLSPKAMGFSSSS